MNENGLTFKILEHERIDLEKDGRCALAMKKGGVLTGIVGEIVTLLYEEKVCGSEEDKNPPPKLYFFKTRCINAYDIYGKGWACILIFKEINKWWTKPLKKLHNLARILSILAYRICRKIHKLLKEKEKQRK